MSSTLLLIIGLIVLLVWFMSTDGKRERARKAAYAAEWEAKPLQHCMSCGTEFKPKPGAMRGSTGIELLLWFTLFGGAVYSYWRRMGIGKAKLSCPVCSAETVVPANAPTARAHRIQLARALGEDFQPTRPQDAV